MAILGLVAGGASAQDPAPRRGFGPPWPDTPRAARITIPHDYNIMAAPITSGGVTIPVQYPQMIPMRGQSYCRDWCDGKLMLVLKTNAPSDLYHFVWDFRRGQARAQRGESSDVSYTPLPIPNGYTEAWEVTVLGPPLMPGFHFDRRVFIRTNPDGIPLEFTQCQTLGADPYCQTATTADGESALQISFTYTVRRWEQRDAIRAAVQRLVRSWMQ